MNPLRKMGSAFCEDNNSVSCNDRDQAMQFISNKQSTTAKYIIQFPVQKPNRTRI